MKNFNKFILLTILMPFMATVGISQKICSNGSGDHGGYKYEYWKSYGDGCMVLKPGGGFSVDFNNVGNLLARKALRPGSFQQIVEYDVDFNPTPNSGRSFVSVYGWTQNPLIEYYIVDAWSSARPTKGTKLGTIFSDGAEYDLYRTERVNKPSIEGTKTFYQYWSIRKTKRTKGTVTTANHFDGWKKAGLNLGKLWEVSLVIEALKNSAGSADVKFMKMTEGTGNNNTVTGPKGYTYASDEAGTVAISDVPYDLAYGEGDDFVFLTNQTSGVPCNNDAFGSDPKPGSKKYCFTKESKVPYSGGSIPVPGVIEAENYDFGGEGVSYSDSDPENNGATASNFRVNSGVDIGAGSIGNAIGWTADGEWLQYAIDVESSGVYEFEFNTSSKNGGGVLGLELDGKNLMSGVSVPQTNDWDTYDSFKETMNLIAGEHSLRVKIEKGGFNLDKMAVNKMITTGIGNELTHFTIFPNPSENGIFQLSKSIDYEVFDVRGNKILELNSDRVDLSSQEKGVYIFQVGGKRLKIIK